MKLNLGIVAIFVFVLAQCSTQTLKAGPPTPPPAPPALKYEPTRKHPPSPLDHEPPANKDDLLAGLPANIKQIAERTFSDNAAERARALKLLGDQHERALPALPCVIRLLTDNMPVDIETSQSTDFRLPWFSVSHYAIDAIKRIGHPAVEPCLAALKRYAGTDRGDGLIWALGEIEDPAAVTTLLELLKHPDPLVREHAIGSISRWGDPRFVLPLIDALKDDDAEVRENAARCIYFHHDPRFVLPLLEALKDRSDAVRTKAAHALGAQRDPRSVPVLISAVRDQAEKMDVRVAAALALGSIADQHGLDELLAVVGGRSHPDPLRKAAAYGLMGSKDTRYFQQLVVLLNDHKETTVVRSSIVDCVARLDSKRAVGVLVRIASDTDDNATIRCRAAVGVVELTDGAIDDMKVVAGLSGPFSISIQPSIAEVSDGAQAKRSAYRSIAKNGKTAEVRDAAKKWLER